MNSVGNILDMFGDLIFGKYFGSKENNELIPKNSDSPIYAIAYELGVKPNVETVMEAIKEYLVSAMNNNDYREFVEDTPNFYMLTIFAVITIEMNTYYKSGHLDFEKLDNNLKDLYRDNL